LWGKGNIKDKMINYIDKYCHFDLLITHRKLIILDKIKFIEKQKWNTATGYEDVQTTLII